MDNIEYLSKKPLSTRELFDDVASMASFSENYLPDVFECNIRSTGERYRFNRNNTSDPVTGKWRLVESGGSTPPSTTTIYQTYADFPTPTENTIAYAMEDYEDDNGDIHKKGYWLYNASNASWENILDSDITTEQTSDESVVENVTIEGVKEDIECSVVTEKVGNITTVITTATADSANGTTIKEGDVISIEQYIDGVLINSYNKLEDEEIIDVVNPFG